jgi:hemoglobin
MTTSLIPDPALPAPGARAGITEDMIRDLVVTFYGRIREDDVLGPIFSDVIGANWDPHLDKMCNFWSSVTLKSARYDGRPLPVHAAIGQIEDHHFAYWLELFGDTARAVCPAEAAELFVDRAGRIAESLRLGVAIARGQLTVTPPNADAPNDG